MYTEIKKLLNRLDEAGGTSLDMSPGNELALEAAKAIRYLLREVDRVDTTW